MSSRKLYPSGPSGPLRQQTWLSKRCQNANTLQGTDGKCAISVSRLVPLDSKSTQAIQIWRPSLGSSDVEEPKVAFNLDAQMISVTSLPHLKMPSRKSHVNSHHGCVQCKARRIKCDEKYPACIRCMKRGIRCSNGKSSNQSVPSSRSISPVIGVWNDPMAEILANSQSSGPSTVPLTHLIHHYAFYTAPTFCDWPLLLPVWQTAIPSLAFANPFLLHSVAALSSMHLAHISNPSTSPIHVQAALQHQNAALKLIRPNINEINPQNASAVFVSSFFISIFNIASHAPHSMRLFSAAEGSTLSSIDNRFESPSNTDRIAFYDPSLCTQGSTTLLTDSHDDIIAQLQTIFHLLRGIITIIDVSEDSIRAGPIAPLIREVSPFNAVPAALDTEAALDRLAAFCNATVQDGPCTEAIANLRITFRNVDTTPGGFSTIFKWGCTIDDRYLNALRRGEEGALVVLALYGVLLHSLDGFWWARGWGRAILVAVEEKVKADEAKELLEWARGKMGQIKVGRSV